ncbi:MAG: glycosyltransferase family 2 protein [Candidatus Saccharimonadales bacterium]
MPKLPRSVIAAIPHYNMPDTLKRLLGQVLSQGYSQVYVLDDNSKNCRIEDIIKPFGKAVKLISGKQNVGAGSNRNRILEAPASELRGAILHFIDADCTLVTKDIPATARRLFADNPVLGAVGGLILNANGSKYPSNFSPHMSRLYGLATRIQRAIAAIATHSPKRARRLRRAFQFFLTGWPDITEPAQARDVFCLAEANFFIPYDTFAKISGFDSTLRYHEAQDLARSLERLSLIRRFDPAVVVKHHAVQVRTNRLAEKAQGFKHLVQKYGLPLW